MFGSPAPDTLGRLETVGPDWYTQFATPTVTGVPASHGLGRGDDDVGTVRHPALTTVDIRTRALYEY